MVNSKRLCEIFEQWKKVEAATTYDEREKWLNTLSDEEMQFPTIFRMAYEYGFNTGYKDRQKEEEMEERT